MTTPTTNPSLTLRIAALRRFAISITLFNVLGHTLFGFEQAWFYPLAALGLAYTLEVGIEWLTARGKAQQPRYAGRGVIGLVDFLLPAHISALAIAMLLYPNDRVEPILFAVAVCIGSKVLLRVPSPKGSHHFFNPSNLGIAVTLLAFPWVGISPPYHFTENLTGVGDWIVPAFILISGALLNVQLTRKHPLILGWVGGFIAQAIIRSAIFDTPLAAALLPMTGVAFVLYTFYMITDPGTTPTAPWPQVRFGLATAAVYGLLVASQAVFGLFFALTVVCAGRGLALYAQHLLAQRQAGALITPMPQPIAPALPTPSQD